MNRAKIKKLANDVLNVRVGEGNDPTFQQWLKQEMPQFVREWRQEVSKQILAEPLPTTPKEEEIFMYGIRYMALAERGPGIAAILEKLATTNDALKPIEKKVLQKGYQLIKAEIDDILIHVRSGANIAEEGTPYADRLQSLLRDQGVEETQEALRKGFTKLARDSETKLECFEIIKAQYEELLKELRIAIPGQSKKRGED